MRVTCTESNACSLNYFDINKILSICSLHIIPVIIFKEVIGFRQTEGEKGGGEETESA